MRCLFSTHWKECQALVLIRKASWSVMLCSQMTVEYTEIMNQEVRIRKTCLLTKPTQKGDGLFPVQMSRIGRFRMHVHTSPSAWKNVYCLGAFPCRNLSDLEHLIVNPEFSSSLQILPTILALFRGRNGTPRAGHIPYHGHRLWGLRFICGTVLLLAAQRPGLSASLA